MHPVDIAYIYPISMANEKRSTPNSQLSFWDTLEMFWAKDRIDLWHDAIFSRRTDIVESRLCFAPHIHRWYEKDLFGLRPVRVSACGKQLTVQYY